MIEMCCLLAVVCYVMFAACSSLVVVACVSVVVCGLLVALC